MTLEELRQLRLTVKGDPDSEFKALLMELIGECEDHRDFMAFMTTELDRIPCCHTDGSHKGTPPMMWPELIRCMIKHAVEQAKQKWHEASGPYGS